MRPATNFSFFTIFAVFGDPSLLHAKYVLYVVAFPGLRKSSPLVLPYHSFSSIPSRPAIVLAFSMQDDPLLNRRSSVGFSSIRNHPGMITFSWSSLPSTLQDLGQFEVTSIDVEIPSLM